MKNHLISILGSLLFICLVTVQIQAESVNPADSTGLPGDNFSLEGALELFKNASSLEDFEKALNQESNHVNNLDLNEDGEIDYIRVFDNLEGEVHAIVLQVPFSKEESQDIAVIEIEKQGAEKAILQIIGDADIYGEELIAEPFDEEADSGGDGGPAVTLGLHRVVVNVWFWPSVRYIYAPGYKVYRSPWYWGYYPKYWNPWRPYSWRAYHTHRAVYRPHYRVVKTHRVVRAHKVYTPRRTSSKVVHTRTTTKVTARRSNGQVGRVNKTKTTTVKTKNAKATKRTTKVAKKGRNGKSGARQTQTTKVRRKKN